MSCSGHARLFLASQHLLSDCIGLSAAKVKHRFPSILHPAAMLWIGGKSSQKEVIRETPCVEVGLVCLGNPCYGRGLMVALSCTLAPGSSWPDASPPATPESCRESKGSALGAGERGSARSGGGEQGRSQSEPRTWSRTCWVNGNDSRGLTSPSACAGRARW